MSAADQKKVLFFLISSGQIKWIQNNSLTVEMVVPLVATIDNPIRLQGQYYDSETGFEYNRHRYFDSHLGQFISIDPLGILAGENLFAFAPNTLCWIDPLGLACVKVTSWAPKGVTPDLNPSRWVMLGGGHWWNYLKSGLPGGKFFFQSKWPFVKFASAGTSLANHTTDLIERSRLRWPPGWEAWKGILGQRVIK